MRKDDLITDYFQYSQMPLKYSFSVFQIANKKDIDSSFLQHLKEKILFSYRPLKDYQFHFGDTASDEEIRDYIKNQITPSANDTFDRNVRQGDWGEVFAGLVSTYFQGLIVPFSKIQWKFNKDKSVFGTDLIAFNNGEDIKDIHYYEIKTRQNPDKKEGKSPNRYYISIWAYYSLKKDADSPTADIANFLEMLYLEKNDLDKAKIFRDIVKNPQEYNSIYEIFLIVEKSKYKSIILNELQALPPELHPLNITIVLIDDLKGLVQKTWEDIQEVLVNKLHEVNAI